MSRFYPLKWLVKIFVWIIRGTPLMLQLIIVYFGPGLLATSMERAGIDNVFYHIADYLNTFSPLVATVVAFVINYACYFSEIYRGGIESISKGQYEAGQVLGMTKTQVFFKVILLQVVKRILAPMSNEIITLVKDTALARVIMIPELIQAAEVYAGYGLMWPLFYTAVFYLALVGILTLLFGFCEKKLSYFKA
jgi:polar amino acid transport system permease protein